MSDPNTPNAKDRLAKFLEWARGLKGKDMLYRGLSCESYTVTASITRRFSVEPSSKNTQKSEQKTDIPQKLFTARTADLVKDARMCGHGIKEGRELKDLEILAQLQHYDAATCLLDFTRNPLVALWFACRDDPEKKEATSGKVVALDMGNEKICARIKEVDQFKKPIRELLESKDPKMLYAWAPYHQNQRITAQQSVFVFGEPKIDNDCLEIYPITKDGIHAELKKLGISEDSLFCDFHGFARNNAQNITYQYSHQDLFELAEHKRKSGELEAALDYYDQAIEMEAK